MNDNFDFALIEYLPLWNREAPPADVSRLLEFEAGAKKKKKKMMENTAELMKRNDRLDQFEPNQRVLTVTVTVSTPTRLRRRYCILMLI